MKFLLPLILLLAGCVSSAQTNYIPGYLDQNNIIKPINENNWHYIKSAIIKVIEEDDPYGFVPTHDQLMVWFKRTSPYSKDVIVIRMPYINQYITLEILNELENLYIFEDDLLEEYFDRDFSMSAFDFEIVFY